MSAEATSFFPFGGPCRELTYSALSACRGFFPFSFYRGGGPFILLPFFLLPFSSLLAEPIFVGSRTDSFFAPDSLCFRILHESTAYSLDSYLFTGAESWFASRFRVDLVR